MSLLELSANVLKSMRREWFVRSVFSDALQMVWSGARFVRAHDSTMFSDGFRSWTLGQNEWLSLSPGRTPGSCRRPAPLLLLRSLGEGLPRPF